MFLTVQAEQYTPYDAHYLPELDTPIARLSEPKNYRDGDDPDGITVLCAEVPCTVGDRWWNASDDTLGAMVVDTLRRLDLPDPAVVAVQTERLPSVYPLIGPEDAEPLRELLHWANSLAGITVLGRQGLVVADNLHHVMAMAIDAVNCLDSATGWDDAGWARALQRFDDHVVED